MIWTFVRIAYALLFLIIGLYVLIFVTTGTIDPPVQPTAEATKFTEALTASGFIDPVLGISYVLGGAFLLFDRTAPLGIILLAPSVVVILLFHLLLSGQIIIGPSVAAVLAALAWRYRSRFDSLWNGERLS